MNDEIKLMLNIIKDVSEHKEGSRNGLMILSCKDYKTLLDYITNLQQENEELKKKLDRRYYKNEYERIKEENERLKEQLFDFKQHIYIQKSGIPQKLTQDKTFMELYDMPTYEDYKSRCEKAIPMLKELNQCIKDILDIGIDIKNISDIEDLLQNGSDKE